MYLSVDGLVAGGGESGGKRAMRNRLQLAPRVRPSACTNKEREFCRFPSSATQLASLLPYRSSLSLSDLYLLLLLLPNARLHCLTYWLWQCAFTSLAIRRSFRYGRRNADVSLLSTNQNNTHTHKKSVRKKRWVKEKSQNISVKRRRRRRLAFSFFSRLRLSSSKIHFTSLGLIRNERLKNSRVV